MEEYIVPFLSTYDNVKPLYQQDNARPHVSLETQNYFREKNIDVMKFPSLSPDLNPMENVWMEVSRILYSNMKYFSDRKSLEEDILRTFRIMEDERSLILSKLANDVGERAIKVLEAKGGIINV